MYVILVLYFKLFETIVTLGYVQGT